MESPRSRLKQQFIMVVEDEEDIVRLLTFHLEKEGYRVKSAGSGPEALEAVINYRPDLIILDIMLPGMDGLEVCRRIRSDEKTASIPILILSARKEELDKVLGLELGADDYIIKPFSVRELVARVRAMLRRLEERKPLKDTGNVTAEKILKHGEIVLYPERYRVTVAGEPRTLTHMEFVLLEILMNNTGRVLTRELLLEKAWGYETGVDTRTVDVHVRYLRQKIEKDPANPRYIETVRGVGYRFSEK